MSTPALLSLFHWRPVSLSADSQVGRQKNPRLFPKMTSEVFNFQLVSFFLLSGFFLFLCHHHCNGLYFCSFVPSLCYSIKSIIAHINTAREGFLSMDQWLVIPATS